MATAKKLPSGSWRCQVYSHTEEIPQPDGTIKKKRIYESFTCDDPTAKGRRKCEKMAAEWAAEKESRVRSSMTLGTAMDTYIDSRKNILSPRTITSYRSIQRNYLGAIMHKSLDDISGDDIQREINILALRLSPKTVKNIHGLISAIFKTYQSGTPLHTKLPEKQHSNLYIPTDADIKSILRHVNGTNLEVPILLAAFGPMRRGEICALTSSDINGSTVHVCHNMVKDENKNWIIKTPKSYAGDRYIDYPDFVAEKWKGLNGRITPLTPDDITRMFGRTLKKIGITHFRFHDLRHYSASIQHAMGIPDAYIMERGGWGNDTVLKNVYRHTMEAQKKQMSDKANAYFSNLCNTNCNTK